MTALKMIVPWVAPTLLSMSALQGAYIQGNVCATPIHFHGFWVPVSRRACATALKLATSRRAAPWGGLAGASPGPTRRSFQPALYPGNQTTW